MVVVRAFPWPEATLRLMETALSLFIDELLVNVMALVIYLQSSNRSRTFIKSKQQPVIIGIYAVTVTETAVLWTWLSLCKKGHGNAQTGCAKLELF